MHLCVGLGYEWLASEGPVVSSVCESDDIQNLVKILIMVIFQAIQHLGYQALIVRLSPNCCRFASSVYAPQ